MIFFANRQDRLLTVLFLTRMLCSLFLLGVCVEDDSRLQPPNFKAILILVSAKVAVVAILNLIDAKG